jgi:DNA repair protein RecO (recombination protein O)
MNHENDHAIVLRITEYSETSQILTLLAARHGHLRLIAKGARRSTKTRFVAGFDLLERGDVSFVPARGDAQLGTLTEWVQRDSYSGLRRDLVRLYGGLYAAELVAGLTEEADPHPELFSALRTLLDTLAGDAPAAPALPRFQMALLRAIGYVPDFSICVDCARPVTPGAPVFFSATAGGLLCRDCELHHVEKRRIPREILTTTPPGDHAAPWFDLLDYHLTHVAGRQFRTSAQLRQALARTRSKRL